MSEPSSSSSPLQNQYDSENLGVIRKAEHFDLFISYKRDHGGDHGQKLAEDLYEKLTAEGLKVWLDKKGMGLTSDYEKRLEIAILHSKKFVCILSPAWVESKHCIQELKTAVAYEKRIVPIHYREFRTLLASKKDDKTLTENEWRKTDRPQEIDFSSPEKYDAAYKDLKNICTLQNDVTKQHTKLLCESYYWDNASRPKSMLLTGSDLATAKLLKNKCDTDPDSSSFTALQNEFLEASRAFVANEVSNRRTVFISFGEENKEYAADLNMELKLNKVSTYFYEDLNDTKDATIYHNDIVNSDNVINVMNQEVSDDDACIKFAMLRSKRVLDVSNIKERVSKLKSEGTKNVFFWDPNARIDGLIATLNGDKAYNLMHTKLLAAAFEWENSDKSTNHLLGSKEANAYHDWYVLAEELGTEPQPNLGMITFVERSLTHVDALRKKRRSTLIFIVAGITLLVAATIIAMVLNARLTSAIVQEKAAKKEKNEAQLAKADAEKERNAAEIEKDKAFDAALKAQEDKDRAEDAQKKAIIREAVADANLKIAEKNERDAIERATKTKNDAEKMLADAETKSKAADESVKEAKEKVAQITEDSKEALALMNSQIAISKGFKHLQLGDFDLAEVYADSAYYFLTKDSSGLESNQGLYELYAALLEHDAIISTGPLRNRKDPEVIIDSLSNYYNDSLVYSIETLNFEGPKFRETVGLNWTKEMPDTTAIYDILNRFQNEDNKKISALAVSANSEFLAIGDDQGTVYTWNISTDSVVDTINYQTHRIKSMAFSPDNSKLAITGIMEYFNIVLLDNSGSEDEKKGDAITQQTMARIEKLYFYNNEVIVLVDPDEMATAWAASILTIKETVENHPEQ